MIDRPFFGLIFVAVLPSIIDTAVGHKETRTAGVGTLRARPAPARLALAGADKLATGGQGTAAAAAAVGVDAGPAIVVPYSRPYSAVAAPGPSPDARRTAGGRRQAAAALAQVCSTRAVAVPRMRVVVQQEEVEGWRSRPGTAGLCD